jgi:hypothetical protein
MEIEMIDTEDDTVEEEKRSCSKNILQSFIFREELENRAVAKVG